MPPTQEEMLRQEAAQADPFTVITKAKEAHYDGEKKSPWVDELISRFELNCRATSGSNVGNLVGSSSRS